jgi:hypothetical protein
MSEPTERDREMARMVYLEPTVKPMVWLDRVACLFAQARAEGAKEEREAIRAWLVEENDFGIERGTSAIEAHILRAWIESREKKEEPK